MAKQTDVQLEGTFGDLIFYKSRGTYLIRAKGKTGNQAPVAKMQASILGKASGISAKLRTHFKPILPDPKSRAVMYRLNNVLQQWLRTNPASNTDKQDIVSPLHGFSFNTENDLVSLFHAAMPIYRTAGDGLAIQIPSFDSPNPIAPLPFDGVIDIKVIGVEIDIQNTDNIRKVETGVYIQYDGTPVPAQRLDIPLQTGNGKLVVIAVSINQQVTGVVGTFYN